MAIRLINVPGIKDKNKYSELYNLFYIHEEERKDKKKSGSLNMHLLLNCLQVYRAAKTT